LIKDVSWVYRPVSASNFLDQRGGGSRRRTLAGWDVKTEDVSMALVGFANGAVASVINSVGSPRKLRFDHEGQTEPGSRFDRRIDGTGAPCAEAPAR
jgi:hypothetical protein